MKNPFRKQDKVPISESPATVNAWENSNIDERQQSTNNNNNPFMPDGFGEKTEQPEGGITSPSPIHANHKTHHPSPDHLTSLSSSSSPPPPMQTRSASIEIPPLPQQPSEKNHDDDGIKKKPNKGRFFVRVWQMIAAIGAFGFQIGATPYSGHNIPFSRIGLLYYVYAICWFSFLWSLFNIYVYLTRRFGQGGKIKRPISIMMDCFLAALFGVGTFYEFAMYKCPPGGFDGWCNFFNTGLFFCVSLFLTYVIQTLWDVFGGMSCLRRD